MSKLVKLAGALNRGGSWHRYLWTSMRHNERGYERYAAMARERLRSEFPACAAVDGGLALSFAKSADTDRRLLGL